MSGQPPAELTKIKAEATRQQDEEGGEDADTDCLFEVPIDLTKALCGYRYDEDLSDGATPFTGLVPPGKTSAVPTDSAPREGGFFSRLFGKR